MFFVCLVLAAGGWISGKLRADGGFTTIKECKKMNTLTEDMQTEVERQLGILSAGAVEIIPEVGLREKLCTALAEGRPLRVKLGLDPSAPDVHLGHTVVLRKLRQFQDLGHEIHLVIGDFTGRIGDPTGRSATRKQMSDEYIAANAATYVEQFGRVVDMKKATVHFNSSWLGILDFAAVVKLAGQITVARMLERDDFSLRYKAGEPIHVHEFFYPLMQGFDSVALKADIELGGTDQKFNLLMGRTLQEAEGQEKQVIMTMPLLEGLDGKRKMSKSLSNYIGVSETPQSMYGKVMSIPDELLLKYCQLTTDMTGEEIDELATIHPRDAKMALARRLVLMYHGEEASADAEKDFVAVFQQRTLPEQMPEFIWTGTREVWIVELLSSLGLAVSNGEARRLLRGGAVRLDGNTLLDDDAVLTISDGQVVQAGKRKFVRIRLEE
jgi:tyrosyl-tRNA synthetase